MASPIYLSPNIDNGYDISDYQAIDPQYGDLKQFDQLVSAFHEADIKVVMDLVLNHTSDQHDWFVQAASSRDNPYHDFISGRMPRMACPTTGSRFWRFRLAVQSSNRRVLPPYFATEQPDLNWENPQVRLAIYK